MVRESLSELFWLNSTKSCLCIGLARLSLNCFYKMWLLIKLSKEVVPNLHIQDAMANYIEVVLWILLIANFHSLWQISGIFQM